MELRSKLMLEIDLSNCNQEGAIRNILDKLKEYNVSIEGIRIESSDEKLNFEETGRWECMIP